jgi:uncharacterized protein YecT (DUF1311 family)
LTGYATVNTVREMKLPFDGRFRVPRAGSLLIVASLALLTTACDGRQPQPPANSPAPPPVKPTETTASGDPCALPETEEALVQCRRSESTRVEDSMRRLVEVLSTSYQKEPDLMAAFATAQAKWLDFRDAECRLRTFDSRDGTAFESYWLKCLTALGQERLIALRYMEEHP